MTRGALVLEGCGLLWPMYIRRCVVVWNMISSKIENHISILLTICVSYCHGGSKRWMFVYEDFMPSQHKVIPTPVPWFNDVTVDMISISDNFFYGEIQWDYMARCSRHCVGHSLFSCLLDFLENPSELDVVVICTNNAVRVNRASPNKNWDESVKTYQSRALGLEVK